MIIKMKISISISFVNISMCVWSAAFVFPDIKVYLLLRSTKVY